jgi:peroxiredoxin family protein
MDEEDTLSLILFSGTDDKLTSAAILAVGAAAMGKKVDIFLQYWGLDAFRTDRITKAHGAAPEAGVAGTKLIEDHTAKAHWSELLRQAKDIGTVKIAACAKSMELFELAKDDLDPLVDEIEGVATFISDATGPITFI